VQCTTFCRAIEAGFEASPPVLLAVGAAAGVIAQFVVYPLDVLRRQMQVNVSQLASGLQGKVSPNTNVVSDSTWLSMKSLVKTHGIRSLFAGIVPTFVKTIPTVAIVATVKGTLNAHYKEENKRSAL
jgi:solute carrier family 25 phosphate transporter 23/24/25/41